VVLAGQDTPFTDALPGSGIDSNCHFVPFHPSANGAPSLLPIAVQAVLDAHETPLRVTVVAPLGFGVDRTCQLVPFQSSASVTVPASKLVSRLPTAMHPVADQHEMPASCPVGTRGGATDCTDHPAALAPPAAASQTATDTASNLEKRNPKLATEASDLDPARSATVQPIAVGRYPP
jgi:hypothetical protein